MQTWYVAYLCLALITFNFVDDYLVPAPGSLTSPLANDDDDEYLTPTLRQDCQRSSSREESVFDALKPGTSKLSFSPGRCPPESDAGARFAPLPLYVFMSLQI
jgi:hypothetical protein